MTTQMENEPMTTVELPEGEPEEGDTVRLAYLSKRSGNVLEKSGEVVQTEWTDEGRLKFRVRQPDEPGLLYGYVTGVGGDIRADDPPDLVGRLSRKTEGSKPHFETHYGDIVRIEFLGDEGREHGD